MVRSIAPALLLFASATSNEADKDYAYPAVEKYSGYSASQETNDYPASKENNWYPDASSQDYEETEESELPSQEYESVEDEHDEDIKKQETIFPCIEFCPIPCTVQEIYRAKYIDDEGKPLTTEDLEQMCYKIVEGMEDDGRMIYEELKKLVPEFEDEALAFGLNVLEGDKDKLELAKEALMFAVMGEEMWEAGAEIEVPAEDLVSASTSAPSDTNELELSIPNDAVADAVNAEPVTVATHYEPAQPNLPTFTSPVAKTYETELPLTMSAPRKEITTKAANAGAPVLAEAKSYAPISNRFRAPKKHSIQAQIPEQLPVATTEAPVVPAYSTYVNHGLPLTEKATPATPYTAYMPHYTRGNHATRGQRATTSFNYPSVSTTDVDASAMPPTETKPLKSVESTFDEHKRYVPASHHSKYYHHAKSHYNGDH